MWSIRCIRKSRSIGRVIFILVCLFWWWWYRVIGEVFGFGFVDFGCFGRVVE